MSSLDGYLDGVCGRLAANPAVAEEVREELRTHLEEATGSLCARGATREEAVAQALAGFGEVARVQAALQVVHSPEGVWLTRAKGLVAGALAGCLLSLVLPLLARTGLVLPFGLGDPRLAVMIGAAGLGGLIGLFSRGHSGVFVGWQLGSLAWLAAGMVRWTLGAADGSPAPEASLAALHSVLLAPLFGGCFGAAVAMSGSLLLALTSRRRTSTYWGA